MKKLLLMYAPSPAHLERLASAAPNWRIVCAVSADDARREIVDAQAVLGNRHFMQSLPAARALQWMQSNSVGMDLLLSCERVRAGRFVLTNARGVYDAPMADHALALALALVRGLSGALRGQGREHWERLPLLTLRDLPTLVFGFGGLGQALAKRLLACDTPLRVVARTLHGAGADAARRMGLACMDLTEGLARLHEARLVLLALPLTSETRHLFGASALRRLPDGAFLINVARGALVAESALREDIERLGGVGLDVCETEPPPPGHWLWSHPRVLLTPHVGRAPETGEPRWTGLFERNVGRWVAGRALLNVVDKALGY